MTKEQNTDCLHCDVAPGSRHEMFCDYAKCKTTGVQQIQCGGELHEFNGREYGEHDGPCIPSIWDGEYPGVKQCRKYNLYTAANSIWGEGEDLNSLYIRGRWDSELEQHVI